MHWDWTTGDLFPAWARILLVTASILALGISQPHTQWVPEALAPGIKRAEHEADHSPQPSVEVKNMWSYTSTPPYVFTA